jgi:hypothetical protein
MNNLTDETLLKRAGHAGRNLFVLACLLTIAATALIVVAILALNRDPSNEAVRSVFGMAGALTLMAVGYWFLTVAARRGNPAAVGVVMLAMTVQIVLGLLAAGVVAAQSQLPFKPNVMGLIIPILVLIALGSSRKVLLELKERGLWERAFGEAKASATACVMGGIILGLGIVGLNASSHYTTTRLQQAQTAELRHAKAFVELVQTGEKKFLDAMRPVAAGFGKSDVQAALAELNALDQKLQAIISDTKETEAMSLILHNYANAVRQWKGGLALLLEAKPDIDRAQAQLKLGDTLRTQAAQAFDDRYAASKGRD